MMRIFSVYKTKSKTRVSEKTPKLAAKKFLEKKKVGTILYLQEHPSEKVHGPYQKTSDKKIMKGGLIDNLGNCYDINYNGSPIPRQCNPYDYVDSSASAGILPINRTRSGILSNLGRRQQYDGNPQQFQSNQQSYYGNPQQFQSNQQSYYGNPQQFQSNPQLYPSNSQLPKIPIYNSRRNAKPQINPYNPYNPY
jgi:hypothetical protein